MRIDYYFFSNKTLITNTILKAQSVSIYKILKHNKLLLLKAFKPFNRTGPYCD